MGQEASFLKLRTDSDLSPVDKSLKVRLTDSTIRFSLFALNEERYWQKAVRGTYPQTNSPS